MRCILRNAGRPCVLATSLLVMAAAAEAADPAVEIRHEPVGCVMADRYARVSASAVPAERVATAEIHFREGGGGGWYAIRMAAEDGRWTGFLPKPLRSLARLEYQIVMTAADLSTVKSAPVSVRVADGALPCAGELESAAAVSAPIVVRVPPGAPVMPPVPAGFSPAGIVAAREPAERGPSKTKWLAAAAIAGGLGGAALARSDSDFDPHENDIGIEFVGYERGVGRVRPLDFPDLVLAMRVSGGPAAAVTLTWRLEWRSPELGVICVTTGGAVSVPAAPRPSTVTLVTPLTAAPECGDRFSVDAAHVTVNRGDQVIFDDTLEMPYTFQK